MSTIDPLQYAPSRQPQAPELTFANPMQQVQGPLQDPGEDPFIETARRIKARQNDDFMRAFVRTTKANPDFAAEAQKLGIELDLDPDVVERNIDKARELQRKRVLENLQRAGGRDILARTMLDPKFAAIAHDETESLGFLEQMWSQMKSGYLQSEQGRIYDRVRQGIATDADRARAIEIEDSLMGLPQDSSGHGLLGFYYGGARMLGQLGNTLPEAAAWAGAGAGTALMLGQAGPQGGLPEEFISVPTMAWAGFRGGMFAASAKIEAGHAYKTMTDMGVSHEEASRLAGFVGLVNGSLELVGFGSFTSTARKEIAQAITTSAAKNLVLNQTWGKAAGRAAFAWVKDAGGEVLTEIGQEISAIVAEQVGIAKQMSDDPSKLKWEVINNQTGFVERIADIVAETVRGVALLSAPGPMASLYRDSKRIATSQRLETFLNQASKGIADTKLGQRSPIAMERFLSALGQGSAVENVYIKPEELLAAMKESGISESQMAEIAPEVWKAYEESRETGMIELPTHTWGAKFLTGNFGQSLTQDMRIDPDGLSPREVKKAWGDTDQKALEDQAKQILEEKGESDNQFVQELDTVREDMKTQIMAANPKMTNEEATNEARLYGHFVTVYSVHEQMSPLEWHKTRGLRFVSEEQAPAVGDPLQQLTTEERALVEQTKIRSEEGKPLRLYHGTTATFRQFKKGKNGIWFAFDPYHAQPGSGKEATQTKAVYVSSKNPYTLTEKEHNEFRFSAGPKIWATRKIAELRYKGYDAMVIPGYAVVAFEKEQVVNAIGAKLEAPLQQLEVEEGAAPEAAATEAAAPEAASKFDKVEETSRLDSATELASSKSWKKGRQFKQALQERTQKAAGEAGVALTKPGKRSSVPEVSEEKDVEDYLVKVGTADARAALAVNANAVGWYDVKTRQAIRVLSLLHPEIMTDEDARFAFVYVLASTSNGVDVSDNFPIAARAYASYKKTGQMPTNIGVGTSKGVINKQMELFNELASKWGLERFRKMMLTPAPAGVIQAATNIPVDGEAADTVVLGAAILGPKIGNGFFSNLYGLFDKLTMDRWLIRTWGRWTGTLIVDRPDKVAEGRVRLDNAIKGLTEEQKKAIAEMDMTWMEGKPGKQKKVRYRSKVDFSASTDEISQTVTELSGKSVPRESLIALGPEADLLRRAANSLSKTIDGQKEDPHGPTERQYIRKVFSRILEQLQISDPNLAGLTMADLQAVLWYAEKRLYDEAKKIKETEVEGEVDEDGEVDASEAAMGYTDESAPDYANAAVSVALKAGISKTDIDNALQKEADSGLTSGTRTSVPTQPGQAEAPRVGRAVGFSASQAREFFGAVTTHNARSARATSEADAWSVNRRSKADDQGRGVLKKKLGTRIIAESTLGTKLANRYRAAGYTTPTMYELDPSDPRSAKVFHQKMKEFKKAEGRKKGAAVHIYKVSEYRGMKLFLSEDGQSGIAVKPDGDMVSLFSGEKASRPFIELAIANGGTKGDAFDTVLPHLYAAHGLRVVSRNKWNEAFKPKGWDKKFFAKFNNGEPDVIFFVYDPTYRDFYKGPTEATPDGAMYGTYEEAADVQAAELAKTQQAREAEQARTAPPKPAALSAPTGRGRFYQAFRTAVLEKDADPSTVIHEMSHFFFTTMVRVASGPMPPVQVRNDVETLLRWFAESGGLDVDVAGYDLIDQWNKLSFEQQEKFHEMLAYNFEIYAFEGNAPSPKLESVFARMRNWMIRAYKDIRYQLNLIFKSKFGTDLPALTTEVKLVFDRMLVSKETVEQAEAMRRMLPLFMDKETFVASGFSEDEWDEYQAALQAAHEAAVTDLTRASLAQLRWLKNARSRAIQKIQKEGMKTREAVEARIREEVAQEHVYMVINLLRGDQAASKLSYESVVKRLANLDEQTVEAALKKLGTGRRGMLSKSGIDPEAIFQTLGYESTDQMLREILAAPDFEVRVQELTDKEMTDKYGELSDPKKMEATIEKALHNEARARFIAVEQRFLQRSSQPLRVMLASSRFAARKILQGRTVRSLRPDRYAQAEARAAREAEVASRGQRGEKGGSPRNAVLAKQRQLLNNQLVVESLAALEEIEQAKRFFKKLNAGNDKLAKGNHDINIVNVARWLVARIGLLSEDLTERSVNYLEQLSVLNPSLFEEITPILGRFKDAATDHRDLTLSEFLAIADAVKSLWSQSARANTIRIENKRVSARESAQKLYEQIREAIPKDVAGTAKALTAGESVGRLLLGTKANMTRIEHLMRYLDDGEHGVWSTLFHDELRLGLDRYRSASAAMTDKLVNILRSTPLDHSDIDATQEGELGYTFKGDGELLGLLLHQGNKSNREKSLIAGRTTAAKDAPWAEFDMNGEVDQSRWLKTRDRLVKEGRLRLEHFRAAQKIWDLMEEIKPLLQDAYFELEGHYFKSVDAEEFTIEFPDGHKETYRGGYVPATADMDLMGMAQDHVSPDSMQDEFRKEVPKVNFGSVKERIDQYRGRPLTLDVMKLAQHIDKSMRFAYVQPKMRDVLRLLNVGIVREDGKNTTLGAQLNALHPNMVKDVILPWLDRAATQTLYKPGGDTLWNEFGKFLRRNTGIAIMMLNPVNALQQLTGISNSFVYVKAGYLMGGLHKYMSNRKEVAAWIAKESDFMNDRLNNQVGAMRDDLEEMLLDPSSWARMRTWTTRKAYALQGAVQNQVDIVTWIGAYDQAMATRKEGETAEQQNRRATLEANSAVRLSQGSFAPEDVARYEVGTPWQRAWTQFTGYFNNVLNTIGYSNKPARAALLSFSLPMMISAAIAKTLWREWDADDPDQEDWLLDGWIWDGLDIVLLSQIRGAAAFAPAVGPAVVAVVDSAWSQRGFGDKVAASPAITTLYRSANGLVELIKSAADEDKDATGKNVRDTTTFITQTTGAPLAVFGRPIGYIMDWANGELVPTGVWDAAAGIMTGRASLASKQ